MPRITHVKDTHLDLDYGYMFDIQNQEELADYWEKCRSLQIQEGVRDVLKNLDGKGHVTTGYGAIIEMRVKCGEGVAQAVAHTEFDLLTTMQRTLREDGRLFVNTNGGYFTPLGSHEFLDSIEVKKYILPSNNKIVITQWPGGEHFYAKVGNEEVVLYGRRKWNTHKEALHAALKFQQKEE